MTTRVERAKALTDWLIERGIQTVNDLNVSLYGLGPASVMPGDDDVHMVLNWFLAGNPIMMERRTDMGCLGVGCMTFITALKP